MSESKLNVLLNTYLFPLNPGKTTQSYISTLSNPAQALPANLAFELSENQAFAQLLLGTDQMKKRAQKWAQEEAEIAAMSGEKNPKKRAAPTEQLINLLGKLGVRNSIVTVRFMRMLGSGLPRQEGDAFTLNPPDIIKKAIAVEDFCAEHHIPNSDICFIGGMLYDWLGLYCETKKLGGNTAKDYLENVFKVGFRAAQIAAKLAANLKQFKYDRYVFAGALALPVGKLLMFLTEPNWPKFIAEAEACKAHLDPVLFTAMEKKQFEIRHHELASLALSFFGLLQPVELSAYYYLEPYFLRQVDPDAFRFAVLLGVSQQLALVKYNPGMTAAQLTLTSLQRSWVQQAGFKEKDLIVAISKILDWGGTK